MTTATHCEDCGVAFEKGDYTYFIPGTTRGWHKACVGEWPQTILAWKLQMLADHRKSKGAK